jgi:RNA polymerase sigma-70 factor (ECF subfamily)
MSASPVVERRPAERRGASPTEQTALLYERYYDRVFGYCLYKLGNREEAEDAVQTTFLWVMRGLERGIEPRLEANWLFTIAQNACRARIKTRGRKRLQETLSDPQVLERVAPGRSACEDELVGLHDALRDMPELQRQAIILREWRGFSYKEIAAELELSDAAVETLIFRARRSLASRLENPTAARPAKQVRTFALNLGSLGAALKSLLGFGGTASLGAVAATVGALAIGLGIEGDSPAHAPRAQTPAALPTVLNPGTPVESKARSKDNTPGREHGHRTPTPSDSPDTTPALESGSPPGPDVRGAVEQTTVLLPPVGETVDGAVDTVDGAVEDVNDVVETAGAALEQTTALPLPQLP